MCSNANLPVMLPLFAATVLLCFNVVSLILGSLISSKYDNISTSLLVNSLIIVDVGPTFLFISISDPEVVEILASLKAYAKTIIN